MRILLVEDDVVIGEKIRKGLHEEKYTVDWLEDGELAKLALHNEKFDLAILDLGLPIILGLDLLQYIRNQGMVLPVIIITMREALEDKIEGFDSGADDFLTKPINIKELCARIRACARRISGRAKMIFEYRNVVLDPASHRVMLDGKIVSFPRREFALLHKLLVNVGQVVSRDHLTQSIYGWEKDVDSNALEVHIHNIRKKLQADFIHTVRGVGYMIEKDEEQHESSEAVEA